MVGGINGDIVEVDDVKRMKLSSTWYFDKTMVKMDMANGICKLRSELGSGQTLYPGVFCNLNTMLRSV